MNQTDPWCIYLTSQMHEKYGFPKGVAHHMVCRWLKSIKNVHTSQRSAVEKEIVSRQVPMQTKTASAKV